MVAVIATLIVVPLAVSQLISRSRATPEAEVLDGFNTTTTVLEIPQASLDPSWRPKGTSAYGEADGDVIARANRLYELVPPPTFAPPESAPPPSAPTTTRPSATSTTAKATTTAVPRTTVKPRETTTTAAPTTQPASTSTAAPAGTG